MNERRRYHPIHKILFLCLVWKQSCSFLLYPPCSISAMLCSKNNHDNNAYTRSYTIATSVLSRRSQILEPHHAQDILLSANHEIHGEYKPTFNKFVTCVCSAACIPRKEMYEAWSTALIIHKYYPNQGRIADLACGHGLLSWSLLVLSLENQSDSRLGGDCSTTTNTELCTTTNVTTRTAVCIDKRMPKSAEKIANAMLYYWPELNGRWDYVESKLESIVPASSTLLCGIHACGILTDHIMSLAIDCNAPIALIPCCHSKKSFNYLNMNAVGTNVRGSDIDHPITYQSTLSELIDELRIKRLLSSNYIVTTEEIPQEYTPQNKMILASPPIAPIKTSHLKKRKILRTTRPHLCFVPVGDDEESMQMIKRISGRRAANERKAPTLPSLCVSIFMPDESTVTPSILFSHVSTIWDTGNEIQVAIEYSDDGPFLHPNGRYARTFSITYQRENSERVDKKRAKELHDCFCEQIPSLIQGISVRR